MKKGLAILIIVLLCGCGSTTNSKVCSLKEGEDAGKITINYDKDSKINEVKFVMTSKLNDETLKLIGKDIDNYLEESFKSLEEEGVQLKTTYNKKTKEVVVSWNINTDTINPDSLDRYLIPKSLKMDKFIKNLKKLDYKCK